jgi:hypothetical protein
MRILFCLAVVLLLATFAPPRLSPPEPPPAQSLLEFEPVPLDRDDPRQRQAGELLYLGGWNVESNDFRFGGLSAMHVESGAATAFSDAGWMIRFPLPGRLHKVRAELGPLPAGPGSPETKSDRDVESMTVHGGQAWIGYERANAVWRYRRADWSGEAAARPRAMRRWRANRGSEAMVRLADGRFLVFSEGAGGPSEALLFAGDPSDADTPSLRFRYRPPRGFRITDAALLPDGRLLFLNRRVRFLEGITAKLSLAEAPADFREGMLLEGREIAHLSRPLIADNFEALSVTREGGRTIVWIASDDNYNPLQRTLLLKFALAG